MQASFRSATVGPPRFCGLGAVQMRRIVAIDPGTNESGFCVLDDGQPAAHGTVSNRELLQTLRAICPSDSGQTTVVIEQMQSYGGPVSTDVFQTLVWSGRLQEAAERSGFCVIYVPRVRVKAHLTSKANATDAEVWAAVCKRYDVPYERGKQAAKGTILHGISGDARQALALAILLEDQQRTLANEQFFTLGTAAPLAPVAAKEAKFATP